jgi:protein-S-isoprenylcysteine O-methyltransferase Ste14
MNLNIDSAIDCAWITVGSVWAVGLAFTKRTVRAQPLGSRLFHVALAALGFGLLSRGWITQGWLAMRFAPENQAIAWMGFILTAAGCAFAIWARLTLGSNWSGRATVKAGHELVTNGPYSVARHPIYTGLLTAVAGTALARGEWRGIAAFMVIVLAFMTKISHEERLMMETFPAAYPVYRQRVRALIPGVF